MYFCSINSPPTLFETQVKRNGKWQAAAASPHREMTSLRPTRSGSCASCNLANGSSPKHPATELRRKSPIRTTKSARIGKRENRRGSEQKGAFCV
jgi:hypothetical protein